MEEIKKALTRTGLLALGIIGLASWVFFCVNNILDMLGETYADAVIFVLILFVPPMFVAFSIIEYYSEGE